MTESSLLYSEIEEDLRESVRSLLTDLCPPSAVLPAYDGDRSLTADLWRLMAAEMGLAGLLVPESDGGAGGSAREAAVVMEELGRSVAPVPFLESGIVAATALMHVTEEAEREILHAVAGGTRTAALLLPFTASGERSSCSVTVGTDGRLSGAVRSVAGALDSDILLVPVLDGDLTSIYAVEAIRTKIEPVTSLDMTRPLADVVLQGAAGRLVVGPDSAKQALRVALDTGAALLASEQLGVAEWCLSTTVSHLKDRRQFGRPIGTFQALKHRISDLYGSVETARSAARYAAAAVAEESEDRAVATAVAASWCGDVAVATAEAALQLHAGIGMTWEHPLHLYLKRAKADQIGLGTPGAHRHRLARLIDLPAPAQGAHEGAR